MTVKNLIEVLKENFNETDEVSVAEIVYDGGGEFLGYESDGFVVSRDNTAGSCVISRKDMSTIDENLKTLYNEGKKRKEKTR